MEPLIIAHRRNTIDQLRNTPNEFGIELDIRSYAGDLIVHHEPFTASVKFIDWMKNFSHQTLILNVKEEGLEQKCLQIMKQFSVENFFFLDQSFPFLIKTSNLGERRSAARISEYESIITVLSLKNKIDWVWVDCFTKFPLSINDGKLLKQAGFKMCLVSPELQGRIEESEIDRIKDKISHPSLQMDAICTKRPDLWRPSKAYVSQET